LWRKVFTPYGWTSARGIGSGWRGIAFAALSLKGESQMLSEIRAINTIKMPNLNHLRLREVRICMYSAVVGKTGEIGRPPTLNRAGSSADIAV
jgi:hypothetical protein